MKINYRTINQRLNVEIDVESAKDGFKKLSEFQEVFDESCCGLCKNQELKIVVRTVEGNDYYELKCKKCFGKLAYGQHKSGGSLFQKRKNQDGTFVSENKGWHKWNGNGS